MQFFRLNDEPTSRGVVALSSKNTNGTARRTPTQSLFLLRFSIYWNKRLGQMSNYYHYGTIVIGKHFFRKRPNDTSPVAVVFSLALTHFLDLTLTVPHPTFASTLEMRFVGK